MKRWPAFLMPLMLATLPACGLDWPCWRGPNHDGVSLETGWNPSALQAGAKVLWTADIGAGYSNVAVADGRLYATGKNKKTLEVLLSCLDAATGSPIWVNKSLKTYGELESTPAVDGDLLYVLGCDGALFCLDAATGTLRWQKNLTKDPGLPRQGYGFASSPIVDGDLLLLNASSAGMALDKRTGSLAWLSDNKCQWDRQYYASPVPFGPAGSRMVLFYGPERLSPVRTATGEALWSFVHGAKTETVADPIVVGERYFVSDLETATLVTVDGGTALAQWRTMVVRSGLSLPLLANGCIFGQDWSEVINNWDWGGVQRVRWPLKCVDPASGATAWQTVMKHVVASAADGKLLLLEIDGTLHIADASPAGYREYSQADVFGGANKPRLFATAPVLSGGRIYCRNYAGDLVCIDASR